MTDKTQTSNICVDIGGTFTDCFVHHQDKVAFTKAPTTPYNLSVGFMRAIKEAADSLDLSANELLSAVEAIRYSTTVAMNKLIERKGPRLGLITTDGYEDTIRVGKGGQWGDGLTIREMRNAAAATKPLPLIPRDLVVGIKERVDYSGKVIRPLDEDDVVQKLQYLVDEGVQGIVVSFIFSYLNPVHEQRVRDIIKEEYPEAYLGSMPVILSSEVLPKWHEYSRTMATILNAYLHQSMSEELGGMGDELRDTGYVKPIMLIHNSGGMAEVFRTTALRTYNGGPVAGLMGCAHAGKLQGYPNIIATDMGGTSFDLGLVAEGSTRFYAFNPVIDRWQIDMTLLEVNTLGAGGGSIAKLNPLMGNQLEVGPQSAGSMPGPACYDQGGTEATVTDADLILGYLNPDYFHGGKILLNRERAVEAIRDTIAKPLQVDVEEAAWLIKKVVDGNMGYAIFRETVLRGYNPKDFVLFAYGGAGPAHCCGYGFTAGIKKILVPAFSPVLCAFGSACMDLALIYEQSKHILFMAPISKKPFTEYEEFNSTVHQLQEKAIKDLEGQQQSAQAAVFTLELDMKYGGQLNEKRIVSPRLFIESEDDVRAIYQEFEKEYGEAYSAMAIYPEGGVDIENMALRVSVYTPKIDLKRYPLESTEAPGEARKEPREAYWPELGGFKLTDVYDQSLLRCGNELNGPAIIESNDTTVVLPPGKRYKVNEFLAGEIE
jgi:N-methylhydantoinase A/oxoprolinase/acetone carboxylase beta subunit